MQCRAVRVTGSIVRSPTRAGCSPMTSASRRRDAVTMTSPCRRSGAGTRRRCRHINVETGCLQKTIVGPTRGGLRPRYWGGGLAPPLPFLPPLRFPSLSLRSPSLPLPFLPLVIGLLNTALGGLGQIPSGNRILCILALKSDVCGIRFANFSENQLTTVCQEYG